MVDYDPRFTSCAPTRAGLSRADSQSSGYKVDGKQVGVNLQQVMAGAERSQSIVADDFNMRELFIPDQGSWCRADAMQIEYRILAHFANSEEINAEYKKNPETSFHKIVKSIIDKVQPITYTNLKSLNFAIIYGAGINRIADMLDMPDVQAKKLYTLYHSRFPEPGKLSKKAIQVADTRGYVKTYYGRRGRFPKTDSFGKPIHRKIRKIHKALNSIIQGTAADIMKEKMCEVYAERDVIPFVMRLTCHDELCGDVPDRESARKLETILNRQTMPLKIPILWKVGTGKNWNEAKDLKE